MAKIFWDCKEILINFKETRPLLTANIIQLYFISYKKLFWPIWKTFLKTTEFLIKYKKRIMFKEDYIET